VDIADSGDNLIGARRRIALFGSPIRRMRERILRYGVEVVSLSEVVKVLRGSIHVHGELIDGCPDHEQVLVQYGLARTLARPSTLVSGDRENQERDRNGKSGHQG
jgi:hypothetical protein